MTGCSAECAHPCTDRPVPGEKKRYFESEKQTEISQLSVGMMFLSLRGRRPALKGSGGERKVTEETGDLS